MLAAPCTSHQSAAHSPWMMFSAPTGELTVDAAVAPVGVLLCQPQDKRGGARRNARPTGPAPRVGPALGDEVAVPAQQGCWLDEEASESSAGEHSCQSRQHRPVRRLQRRSVDLALQDRHLVSEHDDLHGEIGVTAVDESDELEGTAERSVEEREGHCRMLAVGARRRQSPARSGWMTFSAPTRCERRGGPAGGRGRTPSRGTRGSPPDARCRSLPASKSSTGDLDGVFGTDRQMP